jgi:hypothetical protein
MKNVGVKKRGTDYSPPLTLVNHVSLIDKTSAYLVIK